MLDNAEWLAPLNYIDFLRDVGRHFSVNRMLGFDFVKLRLERDQELSFLEFNYMILQAYDFVELHRRTGCVLQMGGSDQWGNIVNGIDLGRRMGTGAALCADLPADHDLLRRQDGQDRAGRGLAERPTSCRPTNTGSSGATPRTATSVVSSSCSPNCRSTEIERIGELKGAEINEAKKILATEATSLLHGAAAAEQAAETARRTFEEGKSGDALPTIDIPRAEFEAGIGLLAAMVRSGLAASNGEARRAVQGSGVRVNDAVVSDERMVIDSSMIGANGMVKLSLGRKRHALLRPSGSH